MTFQIFYRGMKKALITVAFLFFFLAMSVIIFPRGISAVGVGVTSFGGKILFEWICDEGILLAVGPPRAGLFLLTPVSKMYKYFTPVVGASVLGTALPGGICTDLGIPISPVQGTIFIIGTSLLFL